MSVYTYKENELNSGFVGYRVAVMVDGKQKQKWFSTKGKTDLEITALGKKARSLNNEFLMLKNLNKDLREKKCKDIPAVMKVSSHSTGIRGIKLMFLERHKTGNIIYVPHVVVSFSYKKQRYSKIFRVKSERYADAWHQAVFFYSNIKKEVDISTLYARKPPLELLYVTFKHNIVGGMPMKVEHLPDELLEERKFNEWIKDLEGNLFHTEFSNKQYFKDIVHEYIVNKALARIKNVA